VAQVLRRYAIAGALTDEQARQALEDLEARDAALATARHRAQVEVV
jgi:hypothetical protein